MALRAPAGEQANRSASLRSLVSSLPPAASTRASRRSSSHRCIHHPQLSSPVTLVARRRAGGLGWLRLHQVGTAADWRICASKIEQGRGLGALEGRVADNALSAERVHEADQRHDEDYGRQYRRNGEWTEAKFKENSWPSKIDKRRRGSTRYARFDVRRVRRERSGSPKEWAPRPDARIALTIARP